MSVSAEAHGGPISANDYTGNRNRAKLKDIEAADITTVILCMRWFGLRQDRVLHSLELFAQRVLPAFTERYHSA